MMHKNTFLAVILCCFALLALVTAQDCGSEAETPSCPDDACCSKDNFCGYTFQHCGQGCQPLYGFCSDSDISSSASISPSTATTTDSTTSSFSSPQSPTVSVTTTWSTTTTTTSTTTTTTESKTTTTTKGTFQLQPTGKPSGATSSQDKSVKSTVALIVVFFAGLMMI